MNAAEGTGDWDDAGALPWLEDRGVTVIRGTGRLAGERRVAIAGEVALDRLWHAVPSFPTVSEVWLRLLETYGL